MIYNPCNAEMFWAEKGAGAFLNERRLRVSARRNLNEALFATGIPFAAVSNANRLAFARTLGTLMPQVAGIRRFGRYDGFWELGLKPWDTTAGLLLVREAGGYATDPHNGEPRDTGHVVAANPTMHPILTAAVLDGLAASGR